jgi:hypothetical protein
VAAAAARRSGSRTYTAEEQDVMRQRNLSSLTNIIRINSKTGSVRWRVCLFAEGLARAFGQVHGELCASLSAPHSKMPIS